MFPVFQCLIERSAGCNHMTCGNKACKHQFCWLCNASYEGRHFGRGGCPQYGGLTKSQLETENEANYIAVLWAPTFIYCGLQSRTLLVLALAMITDGSWLMRMVEHIGPAVQPFSMVVLGMIGMCTVRGHAGYTNAAGVVNAGPRRGCRAFWIEKKLVKCVAVIMPHAVAPWALLLGAWGLSKTIGLIVWILSWYYIPLPYFVIRFLIYSVKVLAWPLGLAGTGFAMWVMIQVDFMFILGHVPAETQLMGELNANAGLSMLWMARALTSQLHFHT